MASPLEELAGKAGTDFPKLMEARAHSSEKLRTRREILRDMGSGDRTAVIYVGSIGRKEAVSGSDDDFILLVDGEPGVLDHTPGSLTVEGVESRLRKLTDYRQPGSRGIFGEAVKLKDLVEKIGLTADDNSNTTRRMLFLLESDWASGEGFFEAAHQAVLNRCLNTSLKNRQPPRFLLNDIVRYWRTMCVDFAGKEWKGPEKWGIRNAKLRTSRKILFAGGLLPTLQCVQFEKEQISNYLQNQFYLPPTDRIAAVFLAEDAIDTGARTLSAYDAFLAILEDEEKRERLEQLSREEKENCPVFAEVKDLGSTIQDGLLALLFESGDLAATSREYLVF